MSDRPLETWDAAEAYERYVGRWSRPVAQTFVKQLAVPPTSAWADVGCGTAALVKAILEQGAPADVIGFDRSESFIEAARIQVQSGRVEFQIADAVDLPLETGSRDATVSGLVLNFVAEPVRMLGEMCRVTKSGGTVAAYVWDYAEGMAMMRYFWDAAVALHPEDARLDEAQRFPLCRPEPLAALWREAGLSAVTVGEIIVPTLFRDFDDYWSPFLGKQGPAPLYLASVDEQTREQIRSLLESRLKAATDGTIALTARAWTVQGNKT
ncbi:class I SAM-dependent methyltransferase [Deinococcus sp. UYEF24]